MARGDRFGAPVPPLGRMWERDRSAGPKPAADFCFQSCRADVESKCWKSAYSLSRLFFFFFNSNRSDLWFILALIMLYGYNKWTELKHSCRRFIENIRACLCMHARGEKVNSKGRTKISIFKKCGLTPWLISLIVQRFTLCWIFFKLDFKYVLTGWICTVWVTAGRNDSSAFVIKLLSGK